MLKEEYTNKDLLNVIYSMGIDWTIDHVKLVKVSDPETRHRLESLEMDRLDWQDDVSDFIEKLEEKVDDAKGAEEPG